MMMMMVMMKSDQNGTQPLPLPSPSADCISGTRSSRFLTQCIHSEKDANTA